MGSSTGKDELPCQLSNEGSRRCQLLDAKSDPHETSEIGLQSNIFIKTNQNRVLLRYVGAGMLLLKMPQRCSIHEPRAIYTRRVKIHYGIWWLKKELSMVHGTLHFF